ncbi:hypothetical protein DFH06DRAFT_1153861 [Mycena polygramma]|nr:hypothetical protein DFH06DRAFT_1153861 [Mycena polygramma]
MPAGKKDVKKKKNVSTRSNNDATASSTAGKEAKAKRASQSKSSSNSKSDNNAQGSSSGRKKSVLDGDDSRSGFTIKLPAQKAQNPAQKRTSAALSDAEDAPQPKRSKNVASPDNMGDPSVETSGDSRGRPARVKHATVDRLEREGDKISTNPRKPPMVPESVATNPAAPAVRRKRLQNEPRIVREDPPLQMEAPRLATKAQMSLPEAVENLMGNKSRPAEQAPPRVDLRTLQTPGYNNQAPRPQPRPMSKHIGFAPPSGDTAARQAGRGHIDQGPLYNYLAVRTDLQESDDDMAPSAPSVEPPFRPKARPTYKSNTSAPPSGDTAARKAGRDDLAHQGHERDEGQPQAEFQQPRRFLPPRDDEDVDMGTSGPSVQPLPPPPQTRAKTASSAFVPPTGDIAHRMVERDSVAENSVPNGDVDDDPGHYFDIQFKAACDIADKLAELGNAGGEEEQEPAPFGKGKEKEVVTYEEDSDDTERDQNFQPEDEDEEDDDEFEPDDEDTPPRKTCTAEDYIDQDTNADEEDNLNFDESPSGAGPSKTIFVYQNVDDLMDQQGNNNEDDNFDFEDVEPAPAPKKIVRDRPGNGDQRRHKQGECFPCACPPVAEPAQVPVQRAAHPATEPLVTVNWPQGKPSVGKARKAPNPADLDHHRRLQQGGSDGGAAADNDADPDADDDEEQQEEEEEVSGDGRRKRGPLKESTPRKLGWYPKEWRIVIKWSFFDLHRYLLLECFFPASDDPHFQQTLLFIFKTAIRKFEADEPHMELDQYFWDHHQADMLHIIWEEVAGYRSRCKGFAKSVRDSFYQLDDAEPADSSEDEEQAENPVQPKQPKETPEAKLARLMLGAAYLRHEPKDPNDKLLFDASGAKGCVAKLYESRFQEYTDELVAAASVTLMNAFDEKNAGKVVKFEAEKYREYYDDMLEKLPGLHKGDMGSKMRRRWKRWQQAHFEASGKKKQVDPSRLSFL